MGAFAIGEVVLVRFPFSDLSASKLRPALIIGVGEYSEWILCQITSKDYGSHLAVSLNAQDFTEGNLHRDSFIRPRKLFTASSSIITKSVGQLSESKT